MAGRFWIVLRQNLVPYRLEAQVPGLVRACEEFGIDEVLLMNYDMELDHPPTGYWSLESIAAHARQLAGAKEALESVGVKVGPSLTAFTPALHDASHPRGADAEQVRDRLGPHAPVACGEDAIPKVL